MDRSFLSDKSVITASRRFVCIRLATYESESENAFLKKLNAGRGEVQNTTFAVLTPDAKRTLVRPSRSPRHIFGTADQLARVLVRIGGRYRAKLKATPSLPIAADVRIGINIAAADNLPLVVVFAQNDDARKKMVARLRSIAWSGDFIGRFIYAIAKKPAELKAIDGAKPKTGILLVQPGRFGMKGSLIRKISPELKDKELSTQLAAGAKRFQPKPAVGVREHIQAGQRDAVFWKTKLKVTDPMESRARQRTIESILNNIGR